ncbi:MAG TPA: hypothetical protein VFJ16_09240 [Longimicrobium sp.]|nr:hypothetical protein [Longimicrobium sp.]
MFERTKKFVDGAVEIAGEVVKGTAEITVGLTAGLIATPIEFVVGENAVSDGARKAGEVLVKVTDAAVDHVAAPLAKGMIKMPLRKTEQGIEIVKGGAQVVFTDQKEEGIERIVTAGAAMLAAAVLAEEIGVVAGAVGDALAGAAGGHVGDAAGTLLAGATATHTADAVADAAHGHVSSVIDGVAGAHADHAANAATEAATVHFGGAVGESHTSAVAGALRFSGETYAQALDGRGEEFVSDWAQKVIADLGSRAPHDVITHFQAIGNGDLGHFDQAVRLASGHIDMQHHLANIRFGSGEPA